MLWVGRETHTTAQQSSYTKRVGGPWPGLGEASMNTPAPASVSSGAGLSRSKPRAPPRPPPPFLSALPTLGLRVRGPPFFSALPALEVRASPPNEASLASSSSRKTGRSPLPVLLLPAVGAPLDAIPVGTPTATLGQEDKKSSGLPEAPLRICVGRSS